MQELTHYINGEHVKGTSGRFSDVFNPATGEVQAKCPLLEEMINVELLAAEAVRRGLHERPETKALEAELVAEAIAELAHSNKPPSIDVPLRPIARLPSHKPKRSGRRRVVSIVPFDDSPIGGVTTWSRRLSDAFEQSPLARLRPAHAPRCDEPANGAPGGGDAGRADVAVCA